MIEFKRNMLLKEKGNEGHQYRILEVGKDKIFVIDCMKKTMPIWKDTNEFENYEAIEVKVTKDNLEDLDSKSKSIAYQRFTMISPIIAHISDESYRSVIIEDVAKEYGISKQSVRSYLCTYLSSGSIRSLAPKLREWDRPLSKDEKNYRKSLNKWYYTTKKRTLKNTYNLMLQHYYCDAEGKLLEEYPSFYQFRYFFRKYNKKENEYISRNGLAFYQRNQRPLVGDGIQSYAQNIGMGMLDSTILDIYLVNEVGEVVGRPLLVACVDAYSSMCMGYSLLWEGGIYSLRDLMLNVVSDKVEHCRKFGIDIQQEDWNCRELPLRIVTDKGSEYKGENFSQLVELGVSITNLPPYRPELKGSVEKFFDCIQNYYKQHLKGKGVIEADFQERGGHDYRKDACLTMKQFEIILLNCILYYNNHRILESFAYSEDMLEQQIRPHANAIWNYEYERGDCTLVNVSKEELILTLLPRIIARFTRGGLSVNGMHYHNANYREQYLQGKECVVAYNQENVGKVWLIENGCFVPFDLIESRFKDKDLCEVLDMKEKQKGLLKKEGEDKLQAEIDLARKIGVVVSLSDPGTGSIKDIRKNRKREQHKNHKDLIGEVMQ